MPDPGGGELNRADYEAKVAQTESRNEGREQAVAEKREHALEHIKYATECTFDALHNRMDDLPRDISGGFREDLDTIRIKDPDFLLTVWQFLKKLPYVDPKNKTEVDNLYQPLIDAKNQPAAGLRGKLVMVARVNLLKNFEQTLSEAGLQGPIQWEGNASMERQIAAREQQLSSIPSKD